MKLVVGLGNPGNEYKNTRHNVGFMVLDSWMKKNNYSFDKKKFNGEYSIIRINNEDIIFLKPLSFMNLSGVVVKNFVNYFNIDIDDILVIQDDLDMEFGKTRILFDSSSGGHNGINNIIEMLGTKGFTRLKIGISKDKNIDTKDYVLGKFNEEERRSLDNLYFKLESIVDDFVLYDMDKLKQKYNNINNNN